MRSPSAPAPGRATPMRAFGLALAALVTASVAALAAGPAPRRVASLNLAADEILVEILPSDRLVAVTSAADNPEMSSIVGRVPAGVARFPKADLERLIALRPDLVVVSEYTDADFLRQFAASHLRAHRMTGLGSLAGIRRAILDLGEAVAEPAAARRLVARFDARLEELSGRLRGAPRPRALYWSDPFTAGADTAIGSLIECGGARNVGRELGLTGIQPLGAERAFLAEPDVLVLGFSQDASALRAHPLLSRLRAVRDDRFVHVPPRLLTTLSHHAAEACWEIASGLHPERVRGGAPRTGRE